MAGMGNKGVSEAVNVEAARVAWATPRVMRMRAGAAEDGYDPIVPDAGITKS
jgi:hypothetical protein